MLHISYHHEGQGRNCETNQTEIPSTEHGKSIIMSFPLISFHYLEVWYHDYLMIIIILSYPILKYYYYFFRNCLGITTMFWGLDVFAYQCSFHDIKITYCSFHGISEYVETVHFSCDNDLLIRAWFTSWPLYFMYQHSI